MTQITHRFQIRDDIATIMIYAFTPVDYEFASEDNMIKHNAHATGLDIISYINANFHKIHNVPVIISLNGVIIGSENIDKINR